jgi:N-carbamoylputrescine amidase
MAKEKIKVTVCEMNDDPALFEQDWKRLVEHVRAGGSDLVLLNELPFAAWFGVTPHYDPATWQAVEAAHARWLERLPELAPATVIATHPLTSDGKRLNQGFSWTPQAGLQDTHQKYYLPDEEGVWEASWYQPGNRVFKPVETEFGKIGFLICSELWALGWAQAYGKAGVRLLVTPRATGLESVPKWVIGGRAAAIVAGAFSLSSNRVSPTAFGGAGWVIGPEGEILGQTSPAEPFVTVEIDLTEADRAKATYPRYVLD